jgi:hypothetical protein
MNVRSHRNHRGVGLGLRYYYEFWAKNWLEGSALYATPGIPF